MIYVLLQSSTQAPPHRSTERTNNSIVIPRETQHDGGSRFWPSQNDIVSSVFLCGGIVLPRGTHRLVRAVTFERGIPMFTYDCLFTKSASSDPKAVQLGKQLKFILNAQDQCRRHGWDGPTPRLVDTLWSSFMDDITMFKYSHELDGFLSTLAYEASKSQWGAEQPPERLRMVITVPQAATWGELVFHLRESGFMVDHFHVVEEMDGREYVSHLNIFFDRDGRAKEARWDTGGTENPLEESCQGYARISADVWHDH